MRPKAVAVRALSAYKAAVSLLEITFSTNSRLSAYGGSAYPGRKDW